MVRVEQGRRLTWAGLVQGLGGSNEREQGGRQQLRSLGGHKTRAMQNAGSSPAKTCSGFSSLPLVGIRSCN